MKGGLVQLLRIDNLLSGSIGWLFANSIRYKVQDFQAIRQYNAYVEYMQRLIVILLFPITNFSSMKISVEHR